MDTVRTRINLSVKQQRRLEYNNHSEKLYPCVNIFSRIRTKVGRKEDKKRTRQIHMWHFYRRSLIENIELFESIDELHQSALRKLVIAMGGVYLLWLVIDSMARPSFVVPFGFISLVLIGCCGFVLYLLPRHFLLAAFAWLVGIASVISLTLFFYTIPEISFLFTLLPLMAAIMIGLPAAVLVEVLMISWLILFSKILGWIPVPGSYLLWIGLGGFLTMLIGWAGTSTFTMLLDWFSYSYSLARRNVDEARDQRLELKQIQEDLILTNRELVRLSDRLKAMTVMAEDALKAKEEFVANVSHELRTPLNMIIGFTEMIVKSPHLYGGRFSPKLLADITAVQRNAQHLSELVDDVLDLSQVEAGRMALTREWGDLKVVIHQAVDQVRALYETKNLSLHVDLTEEDLGAFCDLTRIREVIINLLSNAGRFTEQGGVTITAHHKGEQVVISVTDTGPGIAERDQARVFEPFQQLDTSIRRKHGGSGLGLAICKRFVEMHDGKMWLESTVGVGTTFSFSLPVDVVSNQNSPRPKRWINPYQSYEVRNRPFKAPLQPVVPRYVVVEQDDRLSRLFRRYLPDVEVLHVTNHEEAVNALAQSPAHLLVINSPMKQLDGSLGAVLSDLPFGTPVATCWIPGNDAYARQLGVVQYLIKPVSSEMLLAALASLGTNIQTVLVADDEPEMLQLFARQLSAADKKYRVLQASTGRQALDMIRARSPQAVILDLMMPEMDGFEVLREMQKDDQLRSIPVLIVSSRDPAGAQIISDTLSLTRSGGLSLNDLLAGLQILAGRFSPAEQPAGQEQLKDSPG